jgi:membrane associated rhomboid family serine protease
MTDIPAKEPMFNAPLLALLLPALILGGYALQTSMAPEGQMDLLTGYALTPLLLRQGHFELLFTHMFLHGSWAHAIFNAAFCLAFATPIIRAFGRSLLGGVSFIGFFLLCGAAAGLGFCALNYTSNVPVIGASGAIYGLIGAALRLSGQRGASGGVLKLTDPRILTMSAVWCGINLLSAFLPLLPGAQDVTIAWQAHIAGYFMGLVLIEHWLRAFHPRYFDQA